MWGGAIVVLEGTLRGNRGRPAGSISLLTPHERRHRASLDQMGVSDRPVRGRVALHLVGSQTRTVLVEWENSHVEPPHRGILLWNVSLGGPRVRLADWTQLCGGK